MNLPLFPAKAVCILLVPVAAAVAALWFCLVRFDAAKDGAASLAAVTAGVSGQARELERGALLCAYNLRGYVASGEKAYLDGAKKELAQAMRALHALRAQSPPGSPGEPNEPGTMRNPGDPPRSGASDEGTGGKPRPAAPGAWPAAKTPDAETRSAAPGAPNAQAAARATSLTPPDAPSALERAGYLFEEYKKQAELAVALYEGLDASRAEFAQAADAFDAAAGALERAAREAADQALSVKYPVIERVKRRLAQAALAGQAAASGRAVRAAYAMARFERSPGLLREALPAFDKAEAALSALAATGGDQDAEAGLETASALAALREYAARTQALLGEWGALESAGEELLRDERAVMEAASSLARESDKTAAETAMALSASLTWSRRFALAAVWGMAVCGLAFAAFGAVVLAGPVVRCSRFARALVKGDLRPDLAVTGRDEAGTLAEALRELARRMGRSFAR